MSKQRWRAWAGILFLSGNLILFITAAYFGMPVALSGLLMAACSISLIFSAKNPLWLMAAGVFLLAGQCLIGLLADGDGAYMQRLGVILPIMQGLLLFRGGWQARTGKIFSATSIFAKPFELIDRYPLASAGLIEAPGTFLICLGAIVSHNIPLAIAAALWTIANGFLIASDPLLKPNISRTSQP